MKTPNQPLPEPDGLPGGSLPTATPQVFPSAIRNRPWLLRARAAITRFAGAALVFACASHFSNAQTYTVSDVSAPGANPSFATGVNAGG